jgi:hypothetical protein
LVVINASVVGAIHVLEDSIGDVCAKFCGDCFGGTLLGTDDCLVDEVGMIGLILRI